MFFGFCFLTHWTSMVTKTVGLPTFLKITIFLFFRRMSYSFETTWEWINVDNFHFWPNYPLTQQPKSNQTCTWICCSDAWCTAAASWGEICVDVTCTCSEVKQKSDHKSLLFKSQLKWQRKWFFSYRTCQLQQWARHLCAVRVDAVAPLLVHHSGGGATGLLTELLQNLRAFRGQRLQKLFHAVLRYSACLLPHILVERDRTAFNGLIHDRSIHPAQEPWTKMTWTQ